ncbi:uncharacterized protein CDV56_101901 [Aspergillus thermomutatus]|uniref:Copper acquisition factor BIM1-like domain-containing protein n=1 Tax=Aspergillus thermomutatus TaxID=41047 RepID=A0A397G4H2_ASPTH|nr:uncharacterized protein CDV56_101901 [Aspergillus thermomutatus]RHZ45931.1 hypothetical protein CDV56_101901 [Aspergillus thermomutatus]
MSYKRLILLSLYTAIVLGHGEEQAEDMGPVAFLWPPDRLWGAAESPVWYEVFTTNMSYQVNGQLALVVKDESWNVQVAVSHKNNPLSNDDFETFISATRIPDIEVGHECYPVPNVPADVEAGSNATFQIKYTSDEDGAAKNETYYACADIIYVPTSQFTYQVPCFNVTADEFTAVTTTASAGSTATGTSSSSMATAKDAKKSSSGLSGGAIAGIVVGSVAAVAIGAILLFGYRRLLQKYRFMRQKASTRNVNWDGNNTFPRNDDAQDATGLRKLK